ncbi:MAG TPA: protein kinase [Gemmatimonadaceae bacterium]|nr:protein kinase [Gemmatimonadaceae bacterium]
MDETDRETRPSGGVSPDNPEALDRWGPFEQLQRVGRGSFGEVYRAFDPTLQRHVALKLLLPRRGTPDEEVGALFREARAIARVRHPNVVSIYGVDRYDGRLGFWSDFVKGQTLADLVATQGPMGPREAALVGIDICRAAGAVHAAGFLHRDIKPANVMREEGGQILLMDFGLTHAYGTDGDASGTPVYMAPELLQGQPATIATDIYAIGVTLFYLLTKRYPVDGADVAALRAAHASGSRRTLLDVRPDLPEPLARVVETAISASPAERFASTGRMIAALSDAIGLGSHAAIAPSAARPRRLRPWMLAPVVIAGALLAVALGRWAVPPRGDARTPAGDEQARYRRAHELLAHYYRPQALETAIPLLQTIAGEDPQFAPAFADLGRANFLQFAQQRDTKYLEPARDASLRALSIAPDLASAHVTLGFLYAYTDQNDLASHELETALRLDKFNAAAYGALAELQTREGRTELVEATLQKAVSLAPDDWLLNMQLGAHYLDGGRWSQAGDQFRHTVELVPDNPRAHNNLGLAYRGQGRLDDAAAEFQKAIDLEPTFIHYRNLGMVLADAGRYPEAKRALARSIEIRPNQYRAWGLLAAVYANEGADAATIKDTYLKAIALATGLLKETPRDDYLLADVGSYYAAVGQEKQSLPLLAQAAALAPDNPEVLYQVAVGYEMLHHRDEALRWLAKGRSSGYPSETIARNPLLAALRADPRYASTVDSRR